MVVASLLGIAGALRLAGIIAAAVAIALIGVELLMRRRARRKAPRMIALPKIRAVGRPSVFSARLQEFGLESLAVRLAASRRLAAARLRAGQHILPALGSDEWLIYTDLHLGCYPVPYTVIGTKGAYAILPTVEWSLADVARVAEIVKDLRGQLDGLSIAVAAVLYAPDADEPPRLRTTEQEGWELWTIGGRERLWRWLYARPGPGLTVEQLRLLRSAECDSDPAALAVVGT